MEQQAAGIFPIILAIGLYLFSAFCLLKIAGKTGHEDKGWWAWIPIVNIFLMLKIAGKEWWWFILLLIPFLGFIILTLIWAGMCKARKKSPWLSLLIWVPFANLGLVAYLAFSAD